nr:2-aminoethylphosphonate--pyruvate transaminase [Clostridium sp. AM58-1XD]
MGVPENDYLLLTPGPLSTSRRVRNGLLKDMCTWDRDYNDIVQDIRRKLLKAAGCSEETYTAVLMQGSGSFGVESVIGTAAGTEARLLVLVNGAYGRRIVEMADYCGVKYEVMEFPEHEICHPQNVDTYLKEHTEITHVAFVHSETTTGILNPVEELAATVKKYGKVCIVDAMSSFGGVPIEVERLGIDYLISSANKCIQGVPGFSFIITKKEEFLKTKGNAHSLSLDLYAQWETMEKDQGKWRFTSPTHVVRAFYEAIQEFEEEGVEKRYQRYSRMQQLLSSGMDGLGYHPYINPAYQGPIITTFLCPDEEFSFADFYQYLKERGFVIYPGKISAANTFRIGNIGALEEWDIRHLLHIVADYKRDCTKA